MMKMKMGEAAKREKTRRSRLAYGIVLVYFLREEQSACTDFWRFIHSHFIEIPSSAHYTTALWRYGRSHRRGAVVFASPER